MAHPNLEPIITGIFFRSEVGWTIMRYVVGQCWVATRTSALVHLSFTACGDATMEKSAKPGRIVLQPFHVEACEGFAIQVFGSPAQYRAATCGSTCAQRATLDDVDLADELRHPVPTIQGVPPFLRWPLRRALRGHHEALGPGMPRPRAPGLTSMDAVPARAGSWTERRPSNEAIGRSSCGLLRLTGDGCGSSVPRYEAASAPTLSGMGPEQHRWRRRWRLHDSSRSGSQPLAYAVLPRAIASSTGWLPAVCLPGAIRHCNTSPRACSLWSAFSTGPIHVSSVGLRGHAGRSVSGARL